MTTKKVRAAKCDICGIKHGPLSDMEPTDDDYVHHQRAKARRNRQREIQGIRETLAFRKPDPDLDAWLTRQEPQT